MYKRKRKQKKIILIPTIIVIVCFMIVISFSLSRRYTFIESFFKDISIVVEKIVMYPFTALNKEGKSDFSKSYVIQKNVNEALEKEIQELKDSLELKKTLTEYDTETSTVLSRNKSYWFNTLAIDKGEKSGIKKDMAVITKNGLVGMISKVSSNSSEVKLITSDDVNYKVSVAITTNSGDTYAILSGYKNGLLKISGVNKTYPLEEGNKVYTSGLGGREPRGIYIGHVVKIENDKYNLSKTVYLESGQDFNSIHYVTILKEKIS